MADAERNLQYTVQVMNMGLQGANTLVNSVYQTLNYISNVDLDARALKKYVKNGGDLSVSICAPEHLKEISKRLELNGVTHISGKNHAMGGCGVLIFADVDSKTVDEVIANYKEEIENSGITDKSVLFNESDGHIRKVKNLCMEEAMLFAAHAEEKGIHIAVEEPDKGSFNVLFREKDRLKIDNIKRTVSLESSGLAGKALYKQLQYENENSMRIYRKVLDKENSDFHVVSLDGACIHVQKDNVIVERGASIKTIDKNDPSFASEVNFALCNMRNPIDMNDEKYHAYRDAFTRNEKKRILMEADKENGRPSYSKEELYAIKKMEESRKMYEWKLQQENPDQVLYEYSYTNEEMRPADFDQYEQFNFESEHDRKERGKEDQVFFDEAAARYEGYADTPEIMTYEQQHYSEEILDGRTPELYEEYQQTMDEFNIDHDRNANGIDDRYE